MGEGLVQGARACRLKGVRGSTWIWRGLRLDLPSLGCRDSDVRRASLCLLVNRAGAGLGSAIITGLKGP